MPERPNNGWRRWTQLAGLGLRAPLWELTALTGRAFCGPVSLGLYLGSGCNLRCRHCFFWDPESKTDWMDFALAQTILVQARQAGIRQATFTGGEPLLYPGFPSLLSQARSLGMIAGFPTNGTLLTPETCRALIQAGAARVSVSIDGSSPEVHDPIRGAGTWDRAVEGIRNLIQAGREMNSGLETRINTVVTAANVDDLVNMPELARSLGAQLNLMPFHISDVSHRRPAAEKDGIVSQFWPKGELLDRFEREVVPALVRAKAHDPGLMNPDSFLRMLPVYYRSGQAPRRCLFGAFQMSLGADGTIALCVPEIGVAGSMNQTTLARAWRSDDMRRMRIRMKRCRRCMLNCSYVPTAGDLWKDYVWRPARRWVSRTVKNRGGRTEKAVIGSY